MKAHIIFLFIVGIVSVIANPVSKQANASINNEQPLSESSESEVNHKEDTTLNKIEPQPNKIETSEDFVPAPDAGEDTIKYSDGEVDIVIEENITPLDVISDEQNDIKIDDDGDVILDEQNDIKIDDDDYLSPGDRLVDNILVDRIKDEIMETAAGYAPIPLFRKKHKQPPRRRFAIRRQFQRYPYAPYRRHPFYYPYYRFYRPSSLRFY